MTRYARHHSETCFLFNCNIFSFWHLCLVQLITNMVKWIMKYALPVMCNLTTDGLVEYWSEGSPYIALFLESFSFDSIYNSHFYAVCMHEHWFPMFYVFIVQKHMAWIVSPSFLSYTDCAKPYTPNQWLPHSGHCWGNIWNTKDKKLENECDSLLPVSPNTRFANFWVFISKKNSSSAYSKFMFTFSNNILDSAPMKIWWDV